MVQEGPSGWRYFENLTQALYGSRFPVRECLKALVYFADGDLAELGSSERRRLEQSVLAVDGIPSLERIGRELGPSQP